MSHKEWGFTSPTPDKNIGVHYYGEKTTIFAGDLDWEVYPSFWRRIKIVHGDFKFNSGALGNRGIYMKMIIDLFIEFAEGIKMNSNEEITNTLEDAYKTTSCVIYGEDNKIAINQFHLFFVCK